VNVLNNNNDIYKLLYHSISNQIKLISFISNQKFIDFDSNQVVLIQIVERDFNLVERDFNLVERDFNLVERDFIHQVVERL